MTNRNHRVIHFLVASAAAACWSLSGCADAQDSSGNSHTNWLRICHTNADCGELDCLCGVCTRTCATETCRAVDPLATCVTPTPTAANARCESDFPTGGVCTTECTTDGGCQTLNSSLHCVGGACLGGVAGQEGDASTSGGDALAHDGQNGIVATDAPYGAAAPSCQSGGAGRSDCGPNQESCCTSPIVTGGTYYRSYDAVTFLDTGNPATVSDFRLDKYEITVGRFREFVAAAVGGWRPAAGSGKHAHLNGGRGLADSSAPGMFESGWSVAWNNHLISTSPGWDAQLSGSTTGQGGPWTPSPGANEKKPIATIDWYQTLAFCIWDGGFLPGEAEWNYAAGGGSEQRAFPWSVPSTSTTVDCAHANYLGAVSPFPSSSPGPCAPKLAVTDVGSYSPLGDGKWGQSDLSGNVAEWVLDFRTNYVSPCSDCAFLSAASEPVTTRVRRGGNANSRGEAPISILASDRAEGGPGLVTMLDGARCARSP